jgi:hypothetical protein
MYRESYVTSPLVLARNNNKQQFDRNHITSIEMESYLQKLMKQRRLLVIKYSGLGNKSTESGNTIMRSINAIRSKIDAIKTNANSSTLGFSPNTNKRHYYGSCSRCHGRGMGVYSHIQSGVCFQCGKLPY